MTRALIEPAAAADYLLRHANVYGVAEAAGRALSNGAAVIDLTLRPLPALAADGYPGEKVRLALLPGGRVCAYPRDRGQRRYKHRNPWPHRDLCLQYDRDDPALRWLPADGLDALVTLIHRHLIFEEAWRRSGHWPSEEAPHGPASGDKAHPVATARMRREAARWARPRS
jgi:hypothetical protein